MKINTGAVISEAAHFASDKTFIDTRSLHEAAVAEPDKYPTISHYYTQYTVRGAKRLITHALISSGQWTKYNCGAGNGGTWTVLQRTKPVEHTLEADIERIRGTASGISTSTLWEEVGRPDCPVLNAIADEGNERFRRKMGMALTRAGYVRRSLKSVYWFAPGRAPE